MFCERICSPLLVLPAFCYFRHCIANHISNDGFWMSSGIFKVFLILKSPSTKVTWQVELKPDKLSNVQCQLTQDGEYVNNCLKYTSYVLQMFDDLYKYTFDQTLQGCWWKWLYTNSPPFCLHNLLADRIRHVKLLPANLYGHKI